MLQCTKVHYHNLLMMIFVVYKLTSEGIGYILSSWTQTQPLLQETLILCTSYIFLYPVDVDITFSRSGPIYTSGNLTLTCIVTLDCNLDNGVKVVIEWSGPSDISEERYLTTPTSGSGTTYNGSLTIRALADQDDGTYTCTVTVTGANNTQQAAATDTVEIIVMCE